MVSTLVLKAMVHRPLTGSLLSFDPLAHRPRADNEGCLGDKLVVLYC